MHEIHDLLHWKLADHVLEKELSLPESHVDESVRMRNAYPLLSSDDQGNLDLDKFIESSFLLYIYGVIKHGYTVIHSISINIR